MKTKWGQAFNSLPEPDQYYENWMLNNSKPELILAMEKIEKKLFDFYAYLIKLGNLGHIRDNSLYVPKEEMKITKGTLDKLALFGLCSESTKENTIFNHTEYLFVFPAWKLFVVHPVFFIKIASTVIWNPTTFVLPEVCESPPHPG